MLASLPETAIKRSGVFSLDDTLLAHYGQQFENIAYLYDHSQGKYVWAHNLVSLHYSDDDTDYPLLFQLWKPADLKRIETGLIQAGVKLKQSKLPLRESAPKKWRQYLIGVWRRNREKPDVAKLYESKIAIAEKLLQRWVREYPDAKLPVTFDKWYTLPDFCRFGDQTLGLPYVGTLKSDSEIQLKGGERRIDEFAEHLKQEHSEALKARKEPVFKPISIRYKGKREKYYSYCATHRIRNFGRQRLVINHTREDLSDEPFFLVSNRLYWQAPGITRIRRHRWPVEVYYEEGKDEGLDQYQLRNFKGIERHIALVAVVYSLLRAAQHDPLLRNELQRQLQIKMEGSVNFWRRSTQAQSLWNLALFISVGWLQGQTLQQIMAPLLQAVYSA